jgi:hypothetical protein
MSSSSPVYFGFGRARARPAAIEVILAPWCLGNGDVELSEGNFSALTLMSHDDLVLGPEGKVIGQSLPSGAFVAPRFSG